MRTLILRILATVAVGISFHAHPAGAVVRTANFIEHNLSVDLGYGVTPDGYRNYFSTYDGVHTWALYQSGYGYSGEARPDNASSPTYRSDYDIYDALNAVYVGYGSVTVSLPTTDSNADGLPDFLDLNRSGNVSFSGSGLEYVSGLGNGTYTLSGTFTRASGSRLGNYSVATSGGQTVSGNFALSGYSGNFTYDTEARNMSVSGLAFGSSTALSGTVTYDVVGLNTIRINSFTISEGGIVTSIVGSFNLTRSGSTYSGKGAVSDGDTHTYWVDYNLFHLKITDNNDTDGDGIPDLSDPPVAPPTITVQPVSQEVNLGQSASFGVTATGPAPLSYQWRKTSSNISGATNATYTIAITTTNHAGSYSVVVSNPGGSATSSSASLTVNVPPTITSQPTNKTVLAGSHVTFTVTAAGTAPLSYQWRKGGVVIDGATNSVIGLLSVTANDAGIYSVVVANVAGSVVSSNATLTVNLPPSIAIQPQTQTVTLGTNATFSVTANGTVPLGYQWRKNGVNASGATNASYTITNVQTNAAGTYTVVVTNIAGSVTSSNATLTVTVPPPVLIVSRQGTNLILAWSTNWPGFTLQSTTNLTSSPVWVSNPPPPVVSSGNYVVTNAITGNRKLYRLRK